MFGVANVEFQQLVGRTTLLENVVGNSGPRIASLEYRMRDWTARLENVEARMFSLDNPGLQNPSTDRRRQNILADAEETGETQTAVASHRGHGAVGPSQRRGFSAALEARVSPPGSVTIMPDGEPSAPPASLTADLADGAPLFTDEPPGLQSYDISTPPMHHIDQRINIVMQTLSATTASMNEQLAAMQASPEERDGSGAKVQILQQVENGMAEHTQRMTFLEAQRADDQKRAEDNAAALTTRLNRRGSST